MIRRPRFSRVSLFAYALVKLLQGSPPGSRVVADRPTPWLRTSTVLSDVHSSTCCSVKLPPLTKTARHLPGRSLASRFRVCRLALSCRGRARQALLRLNRSLTRTASLLDFASVCQGVFSSQFLRFAVHTLGDEGTRTPGLCLAKAPLSQLSYVPSQWV